MKKLTKKQLEIYNWLLEHPGYLKKGASFLYKYVFSGGSHKDVEIALKEAKKDSKLMIKPFKNRIVSGDKIIEKWGKIRDHVNVITRKPKKIHKEESLEQEIIFELDKCKKASEKLYNDIKQMTRPVKKANVYGMDPRNVLVIGDTHFPFDKDGYLDHCLDMQKKYNCGTIIHIGDVADNCYSSFHESNPDGMGAGDELEAAIKKLKDWYKAFPKVLITTGNHCQIIQRKAFTSGLSKKWIRGLNEVLEVPNWQFELEYELNNVLYTHGTGTSGDKAAFNKALNRRKSVVQGHLHSQASIMWNTSSIDRIFAMQVGCGVDESKYAFDYAKNFSKKFIVSCGLVLENGTLPLIEPMKL